MAETPEERFERQKEEVVKKDVLRRLALESVNATRIARTVKETFPKTVRELRKLEVSIRLRIEKEVDEILQKVKRGQMTEEQAIARLRALDQYAEGLFSMVADAIFAARAISEEAISEVIARLLGTTTTALKRAAAAEARRALRREITRRVAYLLGRAHFDNAFLVNQRWTHLGAAAIGLGLTLSASSFRKFASGGIETIQSSVPLFFGVATQYLFYRAAPENIWNSYTSQRTLSGDIMNAPGEWRELLEETVRRKRNWGAPRPKRIGFRWGNLEKGLARFKEKVSSGGTWGFAAAARETDKLLLKLERRRKSALSQLERKHDRDIRFLRRLFDRAIRMAARVMRGGGVERLRYWPEVLGRILTRISATQDQFRRKREEILRRAEREFEAIEEKMDMEGAKGIIQSLKKLKGKGWRTDLYAARVEIKEVEKGRQWILISYWEFRGRPRPSRRRKEKFTKEERRDAQRMLRAVRSTMEGRRKEDRQLAEYVIRTARRNLLALGNSPAARLVGSLGRETHTVDWRAKLLSLHFGTAKGVPRRPFTLVRRQDESRAVDVALDELRPWIQLRSKACREKLREELGVSVVRYKAFYNEIARKLKARIAADVEAFKRAKVPMELPKILYKT